MSNLMVRQIKDTAVLNTLRGIQSDINSGKRLVKDIADECNLFAKQSSDEYSRELFKLLATCKTRKQFKNVFAPMNKWL
ncbi:TPA: hypothetical protein G8M64_004617 [Salmonella enterica]|nr:hypothetical protein [Salmonella enterica]